MYWQGSLLFTYADSDASRIVTTGFPGMRLGYSTVATDTTGMHIDNFLAQDLATTYTLTGPTTSPVGVASTNFTVTPNALVSSAVITMSDGAAGGTFTPTTLTFTNTSAAQTFTYTPVAGAAVTISTNNSTLTDPVSLTYTPTATSYTLAGPANGPLSTASSNFTVTPNAKVIAAVVTLADGGAGGTFTPTTLTFTNSAVAQTFTYTPASAGVKTISATNNGGLSDPVSLSFTVTATAYTLNGPSTGANLVPSTNFAVTPNAFIVSVVITPSDSAGGGTFTPVSLTFTNSAAAQTFTYTPASNGLKTISTTNNSTLTDPASVTYLVPTVGHPAVIGDGIGVVGTAAFMG